MARDKSFLSRFLRRDDEPEPEPDEALEVLGLGGRWRALRFRSPYQPMLVLNQRLTQHNPFYLEAFGSTLGIPSSPTKPPEEEPAETVAVMFYSYAVGTMMHGFRAVTYCDVILDKGTAWPASPQGAPEYQQTQLPFPVDEAEELKSQLIDMAREVTALKKQNKELRQQVQKYGGTQDGLLARIKNYQKALEGMRIAAQQDAKGLLLFSERYNGRVEEVAADSMDVVFDDNEGGTFAQSYRSNQLGGAKMPEPGDRIYAFAAVYRSPAKPVSWNEILREDSGIEDLDFPVEEAEGSIDL